MFEVWQMKGRREEMQVHRLQDQDTLEEAVSLAASTGPGRYQISDGIGAIMDLKVHVKHEPAPRILPIRRIQG